jgi:hypothetical protein
MLLAAPLPYFRMNDHSATPAMATPIRIIGVELDFPSPHHWPLFTVLPGDVFGGVLPGAGRVGSFVATDVDGITGAAGAGADDDLKIDSI